MNKFIFKFAAPVLKKKCTDVIEFNDDLISIIQDMKDTMIANNGIGLAAPQIGITQNIIIVTNTQTNEIFEVINPVITYESIITATLKEGCLSYPRKYKEIKRPIEIEVKGFNKFGREVEYNIKDLQARIFCHEIDHLNGKCKVG
jgi:peptide deformylase